MGLCPKPRRYAGIEFLLRFLGYACGKRDDALIFVINYTTPARNDV